ncbi:hypothetical protein [Staphylococcus simulans]|uniref:hypothetical protein n=1 Tax=Staphylococcus simulans TaxID=1286 RepID=UPI0028A3B929|nr:hypothetical protein [Staphylococcus simulans]MDT4011515.1 hypothetical protein [Staphylococcus simulans]
MYEFLLYSRTDDWKGVTKNRVVQGERKLFSYKEIIDIINNAVETERSIYGWLVYYTQDNQNYQLFLRSRNVKYMNTTTSSKQNIYEWVDMITEQTEQLSLF